MKENRLYIKCDRCGKETSVGIEKSKIENGKTIEIWKGLPECAERYRELQKKFFQK